MSLVFLESVVHYSYARLALGCVLLVSLICGMLSPIVVLKQRSYIGDTLTHLVFPGVIAGTVLNSSGVAPAWLCLIVGAVVSSLLGNWISEYLFRALKVPHDAAAVLTLAGFFGFGIVVVSRLRNLRIDVDKILFGDVLTLTPADAAVLVVVAVAVLVLILGLHRHWDAWVSDPEFAAISGFRVSLLEILFPSLLTLAVLAGMFAVGGLMMSALLTLPSALKHPKSVFSPSAVVVSLATGFLGLVCAFQFDAPVGPSIVVLGLGLVLAKAVMVSARPRRRLSEFSPQLELRRGQNLKSLRV